MTRDYDSIDEQLFEELGLDEALANPKEPEQEAEETEEELDNTNDEEVEEEESEDESEEDFEDDPSLEDDEDDEDDKNPPPSKRTKEDKQNYAFAELRRKSKEAERRATELERVANERERVLKALMKEAGYDSLDEFQKAVDEQLLAKQAEREGFTGEGADKYKELTKRERELAEREQRLQQANMREKASRFNQSVLNFTQQHSLGEDGVKKIYTELEKAGYTVETLLSLPNPDVLIKGIMADAIAQKSVERHIERKAQRKKVDTVKIAGKTTVKKTTEDELDALLKEDLADYMASRYGK